MQGLSKHIYGKGGFSLASETNDGSYTIRLNFMSVLPFISYSQTTIDATTVHDSTRVVTNNKLKDDEYHYVCSIRSPITNNSFDIYYQKTYQFLFIMPSLTWADRVSDINYQQYVDVYCYILGYKGLELNSHSSNELHVLSKSNHIYMDIYKNYTTFKNPIGIEPTVTANTFIGLPMPINTHKHRVKLDDSPITITEQQLAVVVKLGEMSKFNSSDVVIFKHYSSDFVSNHKIKYLGNINGTGTGSVYITLYC